MQSLDPVDRKIIGEDVKDVEFSWPIGMPLTRSLGKELWEVRSNLTSSKIARVIFCVEQDHPAFFRSFIKKTPQRDINLALKRKIGE